MRAIISVAGLLFFIIGVYVLIYIIRESNQLKREYIKILKELDKKLDNEE